MIPGRKTAEKSDDRHVKKRKEMIRIYAQLKNWKRLGRNWRGSRNLVHTSRREIQFQLKVMLIHFTSKSNFLIHRFQSYSCRQTITHFKIIKQKLGNGQHFNKKKILKAVASSIQMILMFTSSDFWSQSSDDEAWKLKFAHNFWPQPLDDMTSNFWSGAFGEEVVCALRKVCNMGYGVFSSFHRCAVHKMKTAVSVTFLLWKKVLTTLFELYRYNGCEILVKFFF